MYDSTGVRQAVGRHSVILNRLLSGLNEDRQDEHIKEMLGHTPFEVFVGSCLGIAVTIGFYICL
jgi:acid phosphatase family membrane protein YuiD